ncbi:unnamed protein product [Dracunculus medinensis]|uniref:Membrane protein BRI3 n=1 Tax=Dracunculus medinensis TaxID=318479 RepID=A0A0N4U3C9_DRAME|nr:unnamed protein product [Dracunculus medinensis]
MAYPASAAPYSRGLHDASFPKPYLPPYSLQPMSQPIPPPLPATPVAPTTQIHVIHSERLPGNCAYCGVGTVRGETDLCCLMCLIVVAIFTFPLGLFVLCCIPCTVHRRCSSCRRIG